MSSEVPNWVDDLTYKINFYSILLLSPMGIILNAFSVYIFSRPRLNKTNMGFLYLWQSVIDCILLIGFVFIYPTIPIIDFNLDIASDFLCKSVSLFRRFILHSSSWITVLITLDRLLYVYFPSKDIFLQKKRNLQIIILIMFALIIIIDFENFFYVLDIKTKNVTITEGNRTFVKIVKFSVCTGLFQIVVLSDFYHY